MSCRSLVGQRLFFLADDGERTGLRPEGPILSAQGEALGRHHRKAIRPEGTIRQQIGSRRTAPSVRPTFSTANPGLRPGLTETALQAECKPVFRLQLLKKVSLSK